MRHATADAEAEAPGGRATVGRGRRGEIVRAAVTVLGRAGCADTSMKEIAHQAGVAPGLLHYYFSSKEELLVAAVGHLQEQMTATWTAAVAGCDEPLERLIAGLDAVAARFGQEPQLWRAGLDLSLLGLSDPAIRARCRELRGDIVQAIEVELRGALGRLPAYTLVPPRDLAGAVASGIDGMALAALVEERDPTAAFRALKVMLLSLVVAAHVTAGQEPPVARLANLLRPR
jgi:AcrR family transcriptional regulator